MDEPTLVFHLNSSGRILHMESLGGMVPYKPISFCLGRTLEEITPDDRKTVLKWYNEIRSVLANKHNYSYFDYILDNTVYIVRMVYLNKNTVLAVVQYPPDHHVDMNSN